MCAVVYSGYHNDNRLRDVQASTSVVLMRAVYTYDRVTNCVSKQRVGER